MCFAIITGRKTTASGNVILGGNDDWPGYPGHVRYEPRRTNFEGAVRRLAGGLEIPEIPEIAARVPASQPTCALI